MSDLSRWRKEGERRWLADGIRGAWEVAKSNDNWWELYLWREDLTSRHFGRYRDPGEAKSEAWKFDQRGN